MEIKLKKQIETLEREITLKSVDLDEEKANNHFTSLCQMQSLR